MLHAAAEVEGEGDLPLFCGAGWVVGSHSLAGGIARLRCGEAPFGCCIRRGSVCRVMRVASLRSSASDVVSLRFGRAPFCCNFLRTALSD